MVHAHQINLPRTEVQSNESAAPLQHEDGAFWLSTVEFKEGIFGHRPEGMVITYHDVGSYTFMELGLFDLRGKNKTAYYALCSKKPHLSVQPSWVINVGVDGVTYGYLLKEPISEDQFKALQASSDDLAPIVPVNTCDGELPMSEWHAERRYSFVELTQALSSQQAHHQA